ncbi:hypothetical protein FOA43_002174 [Brettanomyces nanus]|uniref:DUF221-domain-containing protein n=1 Tax=Eeniella nana TaxID=13502 RepID=A0A875S1L4_EENNA|nr:uncharacterized protein FOA43_002174 [Brettanomyces nanus]QPG74838.1 hypothetical protein FOA43_002174 [Brettanomyces nanus]
MPSRFGDTDPPPYDPRAQTQTVFWVQLGICTGLGSIIFFIFCLLRRRFPILYAIRPYRNKKIRMLPDSLFGWFTILFNISSEDVLQVAGLDSYVFLRFFRMCLKILLVMSFLGACIMSPLRYWLTGQFDNDFYLQKGTDDHVDPPVYLLVCTIFTYIFTGVVYYFLFAETKHIIRTRQRFLGSQKSLTDRTIMITNVPKAMRDELVLKKHIENLGVGSVDSVILVRDYSKLAELFKEREEYVERLEMLYSEYYGLDVRIWLKHRTPSTTLRVKREERPPKKDDIVYSPNVDSVNMSSDGFITVLNSDKSRPTHRLGLLGLFGKKVDSFNYYSHRLVNLDKTIRQIRVSANFKPIPYAFVSMKSVTNAQMAAQALFSPNPLQLETCLAPAPLDIAWNDLLLSAKSVFMRKNGIELVCIAFSALLIIPIRYITSLLNVESIRKIWPTLGKYLLTHDKARTLVTGVLPPYLFTIINSILPYLISFLCQLQGLPSKGQIELSIVRKNFMYIFFNMFLVFTLFGTISSYKALLTDTTKIAPLLAKSMKSLSLFYIDLIVLHGLTMIPLQLLQPGDIFLNLYSLVFLHFQQTPKKYRDRFYKPTIFQVGLILPQHLMIFIITLIYSVMSTKIMICGLIYFFVGYGVYKYQLVYAMVHPYHSTGKVWPIVFQRVCLGLFFLHLQTFGSLALEQSYAPAALMIPLFPTTLIALMYFKRNYRPLLQYIALDAIKTEGESVEPDGDDDLESLIAASGIHKRGDSLMLTDAYYDSIDSVDQQQGEEGQEEDPEQQEQPERPEQPEQQSANISDDETDRLYEDEIANVSQSTEQPYSSSHRLRRRPSTIEEEREAYQSYTYPCLLDPMNGPWAGFVGDYIDIMRYRTVARIPHGSYGSMEQAEEDLEAYPGESQELKTEIVRKESSKNELD